MTRRGWKEAAANRRYMQQLRDSVMSVWEVVDRIPGREFQARDLVCGGEPVTVVDKLGSTSVRRWDRIAMRVMPFDVKKRIITEYLDRHYRDTLTRPLSLRRQGLRKWTRTTDPPAYPLLPS
ncbi:MAG: hypothetical protein EA406_13390 [Rhodospirillales bacterium]|nr:MAG: hypothetical protein EA406_13390 [Rhodospirillales bacterium]